MQNGFKLIYNEKDDVLDIIKETSRDSVDCIEGKYGIEFCRDISDNIIRISIPEVSVLFGVSEKNIESFVSYSSFS